MDRITLPGTLDSLDDIRRVVKEHALQAGLAKKPIYNLLLAVDEVATNIITHGYEETGTQGSIDVLIDHSGDQFQVTLEDDAGAFDPLQHGLPEEEFFVRPLEERPIGGMGLYLTINGVDEFKYEYVNNRNRNIFVVNIAASTLGA